MNINAPEVSVIVPAFNEAAGLARFLEQLFAVLRGCSGRHEVWVSTTAAAMLPGREG